MTAVAEQSSDLPGLTVFFRPGDDNRVERAVAALKRLGIQRLRVRWQHSGTHRTV